MANLISSNNSTTTPLGISGVFTGTGEEVLDYSAIIVTLKTDQASVTDGLSIQWSTDNTNWDNTDSFTLAANTGKTFSFQPVARFFRIVYTNNTNAQTYFRLQTILCQNIDKSSSHRIKDNLSIEDDVEVTKTILAGQTDSAVLNIGVSSVFSSEHGRLEVSASDTILENAVKDKVYTVNFDFNLPSNGTQTSACLFRNPVANTKKLLISTCIFDVITKGNQAIWRIYKSPTISANGTAQTLISTRVGGSPPGATAQVFSGPTTSANGTKLRTFSSGVNSNSSIINFELSYIIEPGNDLLITGEPSANNTNSSITLTWVEI